MDVGLVYTQQQLKRFALRSNHALLQKVAMSHHHTHCHIIMHAMSHHHTRFALRSNHALLQKVCIYSNVYVCTYMHVCVLKKHPKNK